MTGPDRLQAIKDRLAASVLAAEDDLAVPREPLEDIAYLLGEVERLQFEITYGPVTEIAPGVRFGRPFHGEGFTATAQVVEPGSALVVDRTDGSKAWYDADESGNWVLRDETNRERDE